MDQFAFHLVFIKSFADQIYIRRVIFHQENDAARFCRRIPIAIFTQRGG
jgi:hypothetical protein